jgi:hypothetical protein
MTPPEPAYIRYPAIPFPPQIMSLKQKNELISAPAQPFVERVQKDEQA